MPRPFCTKCLKAERSCLCALLLPFETSAQFVILMHPKEQRDRRGTGTGRISHQLLAGSRLFVGTDFDNHADVHRLLQEPELFPCLLFPDHSAMDVSTPQGADMFRNAMRQKRPLFFVLDGSWPCVKKILKQNPGIASLPKVSFSTERVSQYGFKTQPRPEYLSTLESVHELLKWLEQASLVHTSPPDASDRLLAIFSRLVAFQTEFSRYA